MATNFSPCKGSYVLNQFPSNVMFGMNGFQPVERYRAIMAFLSKGLFPRASKGVIVWEWVGFASFCFTQTMIHDFQNNIDE